MGTVAKKTFASVAQPLAHRGKRAERRDEITSKTRAIEPAESPADDSDWLTWLQIGVSVSVLAIGVGAWYCLYARRTAGEAAEQKEQEEAEFLLRDKLFKKRQTILKFLASDAEAVMENRLAVSQIMSRKLTTIPISMPYDEVKNLMVEGRRHHLLVATDGGELLGVISDRDVAKRVVRTAGDLMTREPFTVSSSTMIGPAITMLLDRHISCLPVVDNGKLMGVLTKSDLLMALQCILQVIQKNGREAVAT